jgi:hypothetical protein
MPKHHANVIIAAPTIPTTLQAALNELQATASFSPLSAVLRDGAPRGGDATVVVWDVETRTTSAELEVLFDRLSEHPRPTLVLIVGGQLLRRPSHPAVLPVSWVTTPSTAELAARLTTLFELRPALAALTAAGEEVRTQAAQLERHYHNQLRVASLVQRQLTQPSLTRLGCVSFHSLYRPLELVSGDIFELVQLEPYRVGFFVADASGQGLPAAMLTMFVKRALQAQARRGAAATGGASPVDVLSRMNDDLCNSSLTDCPFVAALCGVLDVRSLELRFARAGAPYPIVRSADGDVSLWRSNGCVLGVDPNAEFELEFLQLAPGDAFIAYSDGLDRMNRSALPAQRMADAFQKVAAFAAEAAEYGGKAISDDPEAAAPFADAVPGANQAALHPDLAILRTGWCQTLAAEGALAAIDEARTRYETLRRLGEPLDDLTILAMQVDP